MGLARLWGRTEERASIAPALSFNDYAALLNRLSIGNHTYGVGYGNLEQVYADAYEHNGPIGALIAVRTHVFSDVRLAWRQYVNGQPGNLFTDQSLALLQRPWPNATTQTLLAVMELDGSLTGNAYFVRERSAYRNEEVLTRLDPCNTSIVTTDNDGVRRRIYGKYLMGYAYRESPHDDEVEVFPYNEVAHYRPPLPGRDMPQFKGQSWISSVLTDVQADMLMTEHKSATIRNGTVPGLVVSFDAGVSKEQFDAFRKTMDANHGGPWHAGKTLYLGAGADVTVVGQNFDQLNLKAVQGAGETRLAAAAGVPVAIVGFSEGLAGSSLNSGNYGAARRRFADGTVRSLWRAACGALGTIVRPARDAQGVELAIDERDNSFLQEDVLDAAEILSREALTIESLIRSGFTPESARDAVVTSDFTKLAHTGLYSVQLQPPGADNTPAASQAGATE